MRYLTPEYYIILSQADFQVLFTMF
ncbi:hypothetical protein ABHD89_000030 [Salinicoccus halitifaciens]|uniref:Uncharacterized protein n=1 Tax=Salinicoccus halitifaciens TaxID=1073415 RepID=A0ABV2E5E8_9STAP